MIPDYYEYYSVSMLLHLNTRTVTSGEGSLGPVLKFLVVLYLDAFPAPASHVAVFCVEGIIVCFHTY